MAKKKNNLQRIGKLDCVFYSGKEKGPLVVFFHGYGADCWDLVSLRDSLNIPDATWVFPNGPLEVPIGPGWTGRAWVKIDRDLFNSVLFAKNESERKMDNVRFEGMDEILAINLDFFQRLGVEDYSHFILGGFSQGAMLTIDTILSSSLPVSASVILSGALIDQSNWQLKASHRSPVPFFQSHGLHDSILPFSSGQKLEQLLRHSGWKGHLRRFNGGHEIPGTILNELQSFLNGIIF